MSNPPPPSWRASRPSLSRKLSTGSVVPDAPPPLADGTPGEIGEWHRVDDGILFYWWHVSSDETTWELPDDARQQLDAARAAARPAPPPAAAPAPAARATPPKVTAAAGAKRGSLLKLQASIAAVHEATAAATPSTSARVATAAAAAGSSSAAGAAAAGSADGGGDDDDLQEGSIIKIAKARVEEDNKKLNELDSKIAALNAAYESKKRRAPRNSFGAQFAAQTRRAQLSDGPSTTYRLLSRSASIFNLAPMQVSDADINAAAARRASVADTAIAAMVAANNAAKAAAEGSGSDATPVATPAARRRSVAEAVGDGKTKALLDQLAELENMGGKTAGAAPGSSAADAAGPSDDGPASRANYGSRTVVPEKPRARALESPPPAPSDGDGNGGEDGGGEAKSRFSAAKRRFSGAAAKPKPAPPKGEKPRKASLGVGRRRGTKT